MRCAICKKPLSVPESVQRGIGPICYAKVNRACEREDMNGRELGPFEGDVICKRIEQGACTNIPQLEVYHSPTGFEWGYGGSGPADFALNVLMLFTDRKNAYRLHQQFKWDFISTMPREGGIIKGDMIRNWIEQQRAQGVLF